MSGKPPSTTTLKEQFGINFRESTPGRITTGIHKATFKALLDKYPGEWFNFDIVLNEEPKGKAGYTHKLELQTKKAA